MLHPSDVRYAATMRDVLCSFRAKGPVATALSQGFSPANVVLVHPPHSSMKNASNILQQLLTFAACAQPFSL